MARPKRSLKPLNCCCWDFPQNTLQRTASEAVNRYKLIEVQVWTLGQSMMFWYRGQLEFSSGSLFLLLFENY